MNSKDLTAFADSMQFENVLCMKKIISFFLKQARKSVQKISSKVSASTAEMD